MAIDPAISETESTSTEQRAVWLTLFMVLTTAAILAWGCYRTLTLESIYDEHQSVGQVHNYQEGKWELYRGPNQKYPYAAMFPGYQAALFALTKLTHAHTLTALRMTSWIFSLALFAVIYLAARIIQKSTNHGNSSATQIKSDRIEAVIRTCQCSVLPILFPFHFLLYTDLFSAICCVGAIAASIARRYLAAGTLCCAAVLTRQDNLMLVLFLVFWTYVIELNISGRSFDWRSVKNHLTRIWLMIVPIIGMAIFILWNGRVGLDEPSQQPLTLSMGNVIMTIVFAGGLFLPCHLANWKATLIWIRTHKAATLILLTICMLVAQTFVPSHKWNQLEGLLRNMLLNLITDGTLHRFLLGIGLAIVCVSLWTQSFANFARVEPEQPGLPASDGLLTSGKMVYLFWIMRAAPVLLIEPRYYIVPFIFWLLVRRTISQRVEFALWGYMAAVSIAEYWGISSLRFML